MTVASISEVTSPKEQVQIAPFSFDALERLVESALMQEAMLSPKPGLVDSFNNGAHTDMNLYTFAQSARAIAPFMSQFARLAYEHRHLAPEHILPLIRPLGIQCEQAMFSATSGVNTHKGAIFAFSLLCAALGYRAGHHHSFVNAHDACQTVAQFCQGLVHCELTLAQPCDTAGYRAYQQHGLTGARGEAESGFATVTRIGLPLYQSLINCYTPPETAQLHVLMHYIAHNNDTNLFARGGIEGLRQAQQMAKDYLQQGGVFEDQGFRQLLAMDQAFIAKRWSPGGSADLLAMTIFLHGIPKIPML
ncbi:MAG: triphosphoribosyl-dephospho-CoA synthase CitG [Saezia sp.]